MATNLYLVIPCYNEDQILEHSMDNIYGLMENMVLQGLISGDSKIILVDDGSKDDTWLLIKRKCQSVPMFQGIKLSRNYGQQNALLAGLMYACGKCDCAISLDADLQDDIYKIPEFIALFQQGYQIVYGVRSNRKPDTYFKQKTASVFYKLMGFLGAGTVDDHADFRLMSNKALEALRGYKEVNLFLRGIVPLIGFESTKVYYERKQRVTGETKYSFRKMLSFALDGITSFSVRPLRVIALAGLLCSGLSILGLLYALISYFAGVTVPGWTAIVCSIWMLGGIQLLCLGVVGEYIGKIFSEVKQRPRYIVDEVVFCQDTPQSKDSL